MPPSTTQGIMFARGGNILHRRLTKLYSDTKYSYATANVTPNSSSVQEDAEVVAVRESYQIQYDRLLAWGYHWTDTKAVHQHFASGDVEIDKRLHQAGFSDVVADVMSEIQRLLNQSGKLGHPGRYTGLAAYSKAVPSPFQKQREEWTAHEISTAKTLLEQLTTCIDVLYNLSESRRTLSQSSKSDHKSLAEAGPAVVPGRADSGTKVQSGRKRARGYDTEEVDATRSIYEHRLFIPFHDIKTAFPPDPPPYEEVNNSLEERHIASLADHPDPVLLSLCSIDSHDFHVESKISMARVTALVNGLDALSKERLLSHNGCLHLLGFTLDKIRSRIGLVFAIQRRGVDSPIAYRTLSSIISTGYVTAEPSSPNLENRFRLAYNITLTGMAYFSQQLRQGSLRSGNIVYLTPTSEAQSSTRTWQGVRTPYILPSTRQAISWETDTEPLSEQIYRHPSDSISEHENDTVPAYDIYSLGLVLLEIGLWVPLGKLWKSKYDRQTFMHKIKAAYLRNLGSKCGSRYMNVVKRCLEATEDLLRTEIEPSLEHRFLEATKFLSGIASDLRVCCVLDDAGPPPSTDLDLFAVKDTESESRAPIVRQEPFEEQDSSISEAPPTPVSPPLLDEHPSVSALRQHSQIGVAENSPLQRSDSNQEAEGGHGSTSSKATVVKRTSTRDADRSRHAARSRNSTTSSNASAPALHKFSHIDIPQADLNEWNGNLMPRLSKLLQQALSGSPASCSVSLMMVGPSPEDARTTICVQCRETQKVQNALRHRFRPRRGWGLVVLGGDLRRSGRRRKPRKNLQKQEEAAIAQNMKLREQYYQQKPGCGASIGAFKDGEHLPPVSFGGTVIVDGQPYGMTVHHMLDCVSEDEESDELVRSAAPKHHGHYAAQLGTDSVLSTQAEKTNLPFVGQSETPHEEEYDSDSDTSTIRPDFSAFDADGNEFWFLEDTTTREPGLEDDEGSDSGSSEDEEATASVGDVSGVDPADDDEYCITQPAIDDVEEDFFPNMDDRDEDHLDSHSLGYVYASSGLRRVISNDAKHEVDWALIKIHDERLRVGNLIHSASRNSGNPSRRATSLQSTKSDMSNPLLTSVTPCHALSGRQVHCCGRSSGFKTGRISQAMALVKLHGRTSFSNSWTVEGGFGIPGDSGAWIYDPVNGELCGHVLAWGEKSKTAFIAPMEVLFEDIKHTLGAEQVGLNLSTDRKTNALPSKALESQQLQNSVDIEVALRDMALDGGRDRFGSQRVQKSRATPHVVEDHVCAIAS